MIAPWKEITLPTLLSNYELRNVYNAYEFGLFYQINPEKSLHLNKKKCIGGKQNKVRITGMALSNAGGDKIQMFIIGKSLNIAISKESRTSVADIVPRKKLG